MRRLKPSTYHTPSEDYRLAQHLSAAVDEEAHNDGSRLGAAHVNDDASLTANQILNSHDENAAAGRRRVVERDV